MSSVIDEIIAIREATELVVKESPIDFLSQAFKEQRDAILDPSPLKSIFCTRRAAKSYTAGLYLFKEAYENPGVSVLYIALTRDSAKKIMWKDVIKPINKLFKLNCKFNHTELTVTLPNGSIIYFLGVDASEDEKDKLLGQKYRLVIIDEAASYTIDMRELVYQTLKPAVADYRGSIVLMGTPGNITKSLFYDVTNGLEPGWSRHQWDTFSNPYMAKQWQAEIDDLIKRNPLVIDATWFQQMYLGRWVVDNAKLVYKFNSSKNEYLELPKQRTEYVYLLGVDLGYDDDSAFVVVAYSDQDKTLYVVHTFKKTKMDITDVANKIKELQRTYGCHKVVIDGANKQAVEEMQKRHGVVLQAADKTGKVDFIQLMNDDLAQGIVKVQPKACKELVDEWLGLIWNDRSIKKEEHPSCPNHLCDAALYIWRYCHNFMYQKPDPEPKVGTPEWNIREQERMREAQFNAIKEEQNRLHDQQDPFDMENYYNQMNKWKGN